MLVEVKATEPLAVEACGQFNTRRSQRRVDAVDRVDLAGAGSVVDRQRGRAGSRLEDQRLALQRVRAGVGQVARGARDRERTGARRRGDGDGGLRRIAGGLLQHLVGDRLRGIDQLGERGDAGVGGLQDLHAVADAVEQVADVAGAGIEAGGGEEVGRIVERAVDLLAGGKAALGGREQISGALQREQVLADRRRRE